MNVRVYRPSDAAKIDEIYNRCHGHFNLPDLDKCIGRAIIEHEDKIIGFGCLQTLIEAQIIIDNQIPKRLQIHAIRNLFDTAQAVARIKGYNDIYAFPDTTPYSEILKKHFKFRSTGEFLIHNLEEVDGE
jgi:hypothetical protein